jgi:hypothetical protein
MYVTTVLSNYLLIIREFSKWQSRLKNNSGYEPVSLVTNQVIQKLSKDWTFFCDLL